MSAWDVWDDEYTEDLDSLRRPVMGRRLGMPTNALEGLRL